jgi:3-oxoacyl-[acyl-carrier protein] reductase
MIDTGLKDKVALITGANNPYGIGAAIARAFSSEKAKVAITFFMEPTDPYGVSLEKARQAKSFSEAFGRYQNTQNADSVLEEIRDAGGTAEAVEFDQTDPSAIPGLFDTAEKALGPIDILVNNAAHCMYPDNVMDTSQQKIDNHFAVNTRGLVLMMQEFGKRRIAAGIKWGRIINISTDSYMHIGNAAYGASKHAMESYSRDAAHELGPHGITVNIVSPGAVQTGYYEDDLVKKLKQTYPLRRIGKPEDIANAVIFFASDQASWITGQRIYVGGGHNM